MHIRAFAAMNPKTPLKEFEYESKSIGTFDVSINISHCGICYSDIHLINHDWAVGKFPMVPGHEIIGTIAACGRNVHHLKTGQRVGVGWQAGACMQCKWCQQGEQHLCDKQKATCVNQFGGYADKIITDSRFVFPIPEGMDSSETAPLLCAGATVYSPLLQYVSNPTKHVGVIGIGGLGHLAIQFARAFGCEVTAFSSHDDKKQDAQRFGATNFINSTDVKALRRVKNSIDFLLNTAPANLHWSSYMNTLTKKGTLCFLGAVPNDLKINPDNLMFSVRRSICGSNIASPLEIQDMLQFAKRHQVKAEVELFNLSKVNQALEKVIENTVRYRAVLQIS